MFVNLERKFLFPNLLYDKISGLLQAIMKVWNRFLRQLPLPISLTTVPHSTFFLKFSRHILTSSDSKMSGLRHFACSEYAGVCEIYFCIVGWGISGKQLPIETESTIR